MQKYIEYLEEIVSQDYTNEMDFEGKISKFFYDAVSIKMVNLIKPELVGVKDAESNPILLDDLMSDTTDIQFASENFGLYIPACELLKRRNFGWFVRMSRNKCWNRIPKLRNICWRCSDTQHAFKTTQSNYL